jgi:hypothetical protein
VLASGTGIDLLVFAAAGLFLLTLERTIGDWMGETLGSGLAGVLFALGIAGCAWYFLGHSSGTAKTNRFFAAADERGYSTAYYRPTPAVPVSRVADSSPGTVRTQPRTTGTVGIRDATEPSGRLDARTAVEPRKAAEPTTEAAKASADAAKTSARSAPSAPTPGGIPVSSRLVFGAVARRPGPAPAIITLSVSPTQIAPARRATLQTVVTAAGRAITEGSVEFTVNGIGAGRVPLDSSGVAATSFASYISGAYEVHARFSGTARYAPASSVVLTLNVRPQ